MKQIFDAFAARDVEVLVSLTDPEIEFATLTGEQLGRDGPYLGHDGMREYFRDVASVWEELLLTPQEYRQEGDRVLVTGKVNARSPSRVISGSTGWIWRVSDGLVVCGRVYPSAGAATAAFRDGERGDGA